MTKENWQLYGERSAAAGNYEPDAYERTLDGYVELLTDLKETQRALAADFRLMVLGDRALLEHWAEPHIQAMNTQRKPDDQIDITVVSERFLVGIAQPTWQQYFPKPEGDSEDGEAEWDEFTCQFDEPMQDNLEVLRELHAKIDILGNDEKLMGEFAERQGEQVELVRAVTSWRKQEQGKQRLAADIAALRQRASQSGRQLTRRERQRLTTLQSELDNYPEPDIQYDTQKEAFIAELDRLMRRDDKRELERGLLMTDQMQQIINESLPSLCRGEPALFVGETGGAKTALAEYIARELMGKEPEFISAYGDVNSYQLMGKSELTAEKAKVAWDDIMQEITGRGIDWNNLSDETKAKLVVAGFEMVHLPGSTESMFVPGPLVRAMESGRPVILDEVNAMPAELLKRLNKIMQLRPGKSFTVQEDSGREVVVRPGFCIIATANEKSKRYKGVDDLSVEFQNRFGANIYRVRYPDYASDPGAGDPAIENDRLAVAAVVNKRGEFPAHIDVGDFDNFVAACRLGQQLFAGNFAGRVEGGFALEGEVLKNRLLDNKPGLEESALAPRTMIDMLRKVAGSHGGLSIKRVCANYLDGIKNADDRAVLTMVLENYGLLELIAPSEAA